MDLISIMPWIWLGILVVLLIIEAATMGITTIWGAISALIMIFVSKTGMGIHWQVLLFLVMTLALLFTTRPLLVKKLKLGRVRTNVDSMLLQEVVVT
ncbi:MAG: NfeD family protein, partial [Spirochaetales bacterium]|nr:NfeD family protein [Spirochaetales bacterium]